MGEFKENEDDTDFFAEAIFVFHYRSWSVPTLNPVNYDRPMIVRSVSKIIDDDGMYVYKINTLNLGGSFYYLTEPDSDADFDALKPGDVIFTALSGWPQTMFRAKFSFCSPAGFTSIQGE